MADDYSGIDCETTARKGSRAAGRRSLVFALAMLCLILALLGLMMWLLYALATGLEGFGG